MQKKFAALRTIGSVMKVIAIIVGVITILIALASCGTIFSLGAGLEGLGSRYGSYGGLGILGGLVGGLLGALVPILGGGLLTLFLYAAGEAIYLGIDIEENTRLVAELLRRRERPAAPLAPPQAYAVQPLPAPAPVAIPQPEPAWVGEALAVEPQPEPAWQGEIQAAGGDGDRTAETEPFPAAATVLHTKTFCPQCGSRVSPADTYCMNCNFRLA